MIISSPTVCGSGRITGAFANQENSILAIASAFPLLTNPPGRAAYAGQSLRYRLSLHRPSKSSPFAWCDKLRLPINWVSFHPRDPVIAIAAGSYDGGWMFEGELLIWNWQENIWGKPNPYTPEVVWAEFDPEGTRLDLIVRPWDEEWGRDPGRPEDDAFSRFYSTSTGANTGVAGHELMLDPAARLDPGQLKDLLSANAFSENIEKGVASWLDVSELVTRGAIWDVAWLSADKIASVSDDCLLQISDLRGTLPIRMEGAGYGAAIVATEPVFVHAAERRSWGESEISSRLLTLHDGALVEFQAYPGSYSFTKSSNGTVLGRLDRHRPGSAAADLLIDLATGAVAAIDLGHYDCFNHFVGIKDAPAQYFLQATPPDGHQRKRLCRLDAELHVESLWPVLRRDGSHASHAMECCGCYLEDTAGAGIVLAGRHYDPNPRTPTRGFIYRKALNADRELWRQPTTTASSAIVYLNGHGVIAAAFLDGTLMLIDAITGVIKVAGRATINAQPTVVFSLATNGHALAVGTFDGRIAVLDPCSLLPSDDTNGRIELA